MQEHLDYHLSVAGVDAHVVSDFRAPALLAERSYEGFVLPGPDDRADRQVDVQLSRELDLPSPAAPSRVRTAAWWMAREDRERVFVHGAAGADAPLWTARLPDDRRRPVRIGCGPGTFGPDGNGPFWTPLRYPLDQLLLVHLLAAAGGFLVHGAGAVRSHAATAFPGRSGAGKTTFSRQFKGREHWRLLSDDRVIVRRRSGRWTLYGTPWPGEGGHARNESATLTAFAFLRHGPAHRLEPLPPATAAERLLPVVSVPWYDREDADAVLGTIEAAARDLPAADLYFRPAPDLADFLAARWPPGPRARNGTGRLPIPGRRSPPNVQALEDPPRRRRRFDV